MPALAPVVDTLDTVPEAARGFYEAKDGKFHISLSGAPSGFVAASELATANGKVVEFRDKNIALLQEVGVLKPLKDQFEGIDPVAAKDALAKVAALGKKGVKDVDDITTLVQSALSAALAPLQKELADGKVATAAERARADKSVLRSSIGEEFVKAGGKAKAMDYIVEKAAAAFEVVDGIVKAQANKFSAEKPGEALSITEWLASAAKDHDFAFEPSGGGGANPKPGSGNVGLKAGQTILLDPTPRQLGENSKDIALGKVKVQYSK